LTHKNGVAQPAVRARGGIGLSSLLFFVQILLCEFSWRRSLLFRAISAHRRGACASKRDLLERVGDCHIVTSAG
jgi:hypothetical protein